MPTVENAMTSDSSDLICVGIVTAAHGIRGEFRVKPLMEDPEAVANFGPVLDETGKVLFQLVIRSVSSKGVIVAAKSVRDRNDAEALRGTRLLIRRSSLPEIEESDSWYYHELVGLAVRDAEGRSLGTVVSLADHGAGDILEIKLADERILSLPFTEAYFPDVNCPDGYITAILPENFDEIAV